MADGHFIGDPYECVGRECREAGGGWFWHQRRCALWQDVDPQGNPVGATYEKTYDWLNTGEPCEP